MGLNEQVGATAARTPNVGYLLSHEPVLVAYGAAAASILFTDSNTAMIKCRQFAEALTQAAFATFGIPGHAVRRKGNQAEREGNVIDE